MIRKIYKNLICKWLIIDAIILLLGNIMHTKQECLLLPQQVAMLVYNYIWSRLYKIFIFSYLKIIVMFTCFGIFLLQKADIYICLFKKEQC